MPPYLTISTILSGNLPTLVPPNFWTTQLPPPGRFFSIVWGIDVGWVDVCPLALKLPAGAIVTLAVVFESGGCIVEERVGANGALVESYIFPPTSGRT
jgi:hypothetical protein